MILLILYYIIQHCRSVPVLTILYCQRSSQHTRKKRRKNKSTYSKYTTSTGNQPFACPLATVSMSEPCANHQQRQPLCSPWLRDLGIKKTSTSRPSTHTHSPIASNVYYGYVRHQGMSTPEYAFRARDTTRAFIFAGRGGRGGRDAFGLPGG